MHFFVISNNLSNYQVMGRTYRVRGGKSLPKIFEMALRALNRQDLKGTATALLPWHKELISPIQHRNIHMFVWRHK